MPHKVSDKLKHRINYSRTPIETIPMGKWNKHFEQIFSSKQKVQTNLQLVPEYIGVSIVGGVCIGSGSQWFLAMNVINWSLLSTWLWQKLTWSSSYPISWLSSFSIIMQEVNLGKLCVTELGKHRLEGGLESVNFLIMGGAWGQHRVLGDRDHGGQHHHFVLQEDEEKYHQNLRYDFRDEEKKKKDQRKIAEDPKVPPVLGCNMWTLQNFQRLAWRRF